MTDEELEELVMAYQEALAKATKSSGKPTPKVKHPSKMTEARLLAVTYFAMQWDRRGRKF